MVIEGSRAATLFQTESVILAHYYLFLVKSQLKVINLRIIYQVLQLPLKIKKFNS
jgi:hypothetical protein